MAGEYVIEDDCATALLLARGRTLLDLHRTPEGVVFEFAGAPRRAPLRITVRSEGVSFVEVTRGDS